MAFPVLWWMLDKKGNSNTADRTGQWLSQHKPITIKKHGRKAKSIFRSGFDYLRRLLINLGQYETDFCRSLHSRLFFY